MTSLAWGTKQAIFLVAVLPIGCSPSIDNDWLRWGSSVSPVHWRWFKVIVWYAGFSICHMFHHFPIAEGRQQCQCRIVTVPAPRCTHLRISHPSLTVILSYPVLWHPLLSHSGVSTWGIPHLNGQLGHLKSDSDDQPLTSGILQGYVLPILLVKIPTFFCFMPFGFERTATPYHCLVEKVLSRLKCPSHKLIPHCQSHPLLIKIIQNDIPLNMIPFPHYCLNMSQLYSYKSMCCFWLN